MKDVQCYELFRGIALKNHAFSFFFHFHFNVTLNQLCIFLVFGISLNVFHMCRVFHLVVTIIFDE